MPSASGPPPRDSVTAIIATPSTTITRRATLTGTISKIDWVNPHVYIYLDVKDDTGKVTIPAKKAAAGKPKAAASEE